jgi:hypothetical protein
LSIAEQSKKSVMTKIFAPFSVALNTRNERIMCRTLKALQQLAKSGDFIGQVTLLSIIMRDW